MAHLPICVALLAVLGAAVPAVAEEPRPVAIHSLRLYLPEEALRARLGEDVTPLATYARALHAAAARHWQTAPPSTATGILLAVGVKPGRRSRIWCEAVGGTVPAASLEKMQRDLGAIEPLAVKNGPVAFAIELQLGSGPAPLFLDAPTAWKEASRRAGRALAVPDELFPLIWPD